MVREQGIYLQVRANMEITPIANYPSRNVERGSRTLSKNASCWVFGAYKANKVKLTLKQGTL